MAQVDFHERQVTLKLVYCGPPQSGKTTNLRTLHRCVDAPGRGRLMTLDTVGDRTLFFDLLPIVFRASGFSFRIKVYTVPGQPIHDATRRIVLQGADGIVFVADSTPSQAAANREAWDNLVRHIDALELRRAPLIVQYNKRDLAERVDLAHADRFLEDDRTMHEASALTGEGVIATFFSLAEAVWASLDRDLGLSARFGVDSEAFRTALGAHVGLADHDSVAP